MRYVKKNSFNYQQFCDKVNFVREKNSCLENFIIESFVINNKIVIIFSFLYGNNKMVVKNKMWWKTQFMQQQKKSYRDRTKKSSCDNNKKLNFWSNSKTSTMRKTLKLYLWHNSTKYFGMKHQHSNCDRTQHLTFVKHSNTQIVTRLKLWTKNKKKNRSQN